MHDVGEQTAHSGFAMGACNGKSMFAVGYFSQ
jgi:hypothetical protein